MKANHNYEVAHKQRNSVVSNGSKILKWKQITTIGYPSKTAHWVVSNGSKILKWKQITTSGQPYIEEVELFLMVQRY